MAQKLYVAKPQQVLAEQFTEGMSPDAVGVHRCSLSPLTPDPGPPHVHADGLIYLLQDTDWILSDRWTQQPTGVLTDARFHDIFGAGPPSGEGET